MKTLKMIALATVLALPTTLATASFAQTGGAPGAKGPQGKMDGKRGDGKRGRGMRGGMMGGGMMRRVARELGLSAAQKTRMEALGKESGAKSRAIRENKSLSQDQRRAQMKALRTSSMGRMNAILTPAQRTKFAAMQAKMEQRMRENGGRMGGPGGPGGPGR